MENVVYICPECGHEAVVPGFCPECNVALIASCPVCRNPVVGEHIHPED